MSVDKKNPRVHWQWLVIYNMFSKSKKKKLDGRLYYIFFDIHGARERDEQKKT